MCRILEEAWRNKDDSDTLPDLRGVNATERQKHKQMIRNHHAMIRNPSFLWSLERWVGFYLTWRRKSQWDGTVQFSRRKRETWEDGKAHNLGREVAFYLKGGCIAEEWEASLIHRPTSGIQQLRVPRTLCWENLHQEVVPH